MSSGPVVTSMVLLTMLVVALFCLLIYLCFKNGPYVPNSYEKDSMEESFWSYRRLRPELFKLM